MWNEDRSLVVTFNGEIYNFQSLRDELAARGHVFRTTSDTEVLLHLYRADGAEMVRRLRGMFAFALWDVKRRRLLLARDPYGIKPLYYADDGGTLRFASQVKALLAGGAIDGTPDAASWAGFYLLGSIPEPFTTYRGIRALPAGTSLVIDAEGVSAPQRYFSIAQTYLDAARGARRPETSFGDFAQALRDSVRAHLVADVPVGCFLSAGVDSCGLLALMSEVSPEPIRAVTLGFEEFAGTSNDEVPLARLAARTYGVEHHVRMIGGAEFRADLPRIVAAMDQPSIDGINSWFVAKATREQGLKVAISGLGGDELLGGYPTFADVPAWIARCRPLSRIKGLGRLSRIAIAAAQTALPLGSPKLAGMLELGGTFPGAYLLRRGLYMPWELAGLLGPEAARAGLDRLRPYELIGAALDPDPASDFARVATLEASLYMRNQLLRDTDWASMAHSLEVRVPLVDSALLTAAARLIKAPAKGALAAAPMRPLPQEIAGRAKTGFATPVARWLDEAANAATVTDVRMERPTTGLGSRAWARAVAALWHADVGTAAAPTGRERAHA
jgi:asparagine synthase (glutamine-hydrolysing)